MFVDTKKRNQETTLHRISLRYLNTLDQLEKKESVEKMSEEHIISKEIQELLSSKHKTLKDINEAFEKKKRELNNRKYITEKRPWSKSEKMKRKIGRSIYLKQSNFPLKMFVFQETFLHELEEPEIRLGYYLVSPKILKERGEIRLVWGQYNPNIPKKDLVKLTSIAKERGII